MDESAISEEISLDNKQENIEDIAEENTEAIVEEIIEEEPAEEEPGEALGEEIEVEATEPEVEELSSAGDFIVSGSTITGYTGSSTEIVIPVNIDGVDITAIGDDAFKEKNITKLEFASGSKITTIGKRAFYSCESLETVKLPNTLKTIGESAFSRCSLGKDTELGTITIPKSVNTIGEYAFYKSEYLGYVTFEADNTLSAGSGSGIILGKGIFENSKYLKKIELSENVVTLPTSFARESKALEEVTWPTSLKKISGGTEYGGVGSFAICESLKSADLSGTGITELGACAFLSCKSLETVKLPNTLTTIGNSAFAKSPLGKDTELGSIVIPNSIKSIDDYAFEECNYLRNVTFVEIEGNPLIDGMKLGSGVFCDNKNLKNLKLNKNVISIPRDFAKNCQKLVYITATGDVKSVADYAFYVEKVNNKNLGTDLTTNSSKLSSYDWKSSNRVLTDLPEDTGIDPDSESIVDADDPETNTVLVEKSGSSSEGNVTITLKTNSLTYTGSEVRPAVTVKYYYNTVSGTKTVAKTLSLKENVDYILEYSNNTEVGTGKVVVKGIGDFSGSIEKTFSIVQKSIKGVTIIAPSQILNSKGLTEALMNEISVYDGANLVATDEYTLTGVSENLSATTTINIGIQAKNKNYTGVSNKKAKVLVIADSGEYASATDFKLEWGNTRTDNFVYTGKAIKPKATVTLNGAKLTAKDYQLVYSNNVHAGTATVSVIGKGKYIGKSSSTLSFTIKPKNVSKLKLSKVGNRKIDTQDSDLRLTVKDGKKVLTQGKEYVLSTNGIAPVPVKDNKGNIKYSEITYTLKAAELTDGNKYHDYEGSRDIKIKLYRKSLSNIFVTRVKRKSGCSISTNNGKLPVQVYYNGKLLTENVDYKLTYKNISAGKKASVIISGLGNYTGSRTIKYKVTR